MFQEVKDHFTMRRLSNICKIPEFRVLYEHWATKADLKSFSDQQLKAHKNK